MKGGGPIEARPDIHALRYPAAHRHRHRRAVSGVCLPDLALPPHRGGDHGPLPAHHAGLFRPPLPDGGGADGGGVQPVRRVLCPGPAGGGGPGAPPVSAGLSRPVRGAGRRHRPAVRPHFGVPAGGRPHPDGASSAAALHPAHRRGKPP